MNIRQLIAAAIVFSVSGAAFAQASADNTAPQGKTRAQVIAELKQAQADGSASTFGFLGTGNPLAIGKPTQRQQAHADGGASFGFLGSDVASAAAMNQAQVANAAGPSKTRAAVTAELARAERRGTLQTGSFAGFHDPVAPAPFQVTGQTMAHN